MKEKEDFKVVENSTNELQMRIEEKYRDLSKGQKRVAEYVLDNYDKAVFLTAARLGEVVGVSESTVVRFATQLGYKGYPEFQKALEELVRNRLNSIQRMKVTYGRISQSQIFMSFYLNLLCDNVIAVNTNSSSEIFEQLIRIGEDDVIIGISFPRYSQRTLKALEFASKRKAKIITLTDSVHSPINIYSSCNLIARSDMASIVDSLVAPLSVVNALIVALCMKKQEEVIGTLETLEQIWGEYQVYSGDELNRIEDNSEV